jgi:tetratricopeptide (TPR) repeat protein
MAIRGPDVPSWGELAFRGRPLLVAFWDSSCPPCLAEIHEFEQRRADLLQSDVEIIALTPGSNDPSLEAKAREQIQRTGFTFRWGYVNQGDLELVEAFLGHINAYRRPLAVPLSVLLDGSGRIAVVYRGPLEVDRLLRDIRLLSESSARLRGQASRFSGIWFHPVANRSPLRFAAMLKEEGNLAGAERYLRHLVSMSRDYGADVAACTKPWRGEAAFALGSVLAEQERFDESIQANRWAAEHLPEDHRPHANIGSALLSLGDAPTAIMHLTKALEIAPDDEAVLLNRANANLRLNNIGGALADFELVLERNPRNLTARQSAAALCFRQGADRRAADHYRALLDAQPDSVDARGALAWILATSSDDQLRDGATALGLARAWCQHTNNADPRALNALAAAQAEVGDFQAAIRNIELAMRLVGSKNESLIRSYQSRLRGYQNGQPYRREAKRP